MLVDAETLHKLTKLGPERPLPMDSQLQLWPLLPELVERLNNLVHVLGPLKTTSIQNPGRVGRLPVIPRLEYGVDSIWDNVNLLARTGKFVSHRSCLKLGHADYAVHLFDQPQQ